MLYFLLLCFLNPGGVSGGTRPLAMAVRNSCLLRCTIWACSIILLRGVRRYNLFTIWDKISVHSSSSVCKYYMYVYITCQSISHVCIYYMSVNITCMYILHVGQYYMYVYITCRSILHVCIYYMSVNITCMYILHVSQYYMYVQRYTLHVGQYGSICKYYMSVNITCMYILHVGQYGSIGKYYMAVNITCMYILHVGEYGSVCKYYMSVNMDLKFSSKLLYHHWNVDIVTRANNMNLTEIMHILSVKAWYKTVH